MLGTNSSMQTVEPVPEHREGRHRRAHVLGEASGMKRDFSWAFKCKILAGGEARKILPDIIWVDGLAHFCVCNTEQMS